MEHNIHQSFKITLTQRNCHTHDGIKMLLPLFPKCVLKYYLAVYFKRRLSEYVNQIILYKVIYINIIWQ